MHKRDVYYRPVQGYPEWGRVMSNRPEDYQALIDWCGKKSAVGRYLIDKEGDPVSGDFRAKMSRFFWLRDPPLTLDITHYVRQMSRWWGREGRLPQVEEYHNLLYPKHPIELIKGARSAPPNRKYSRQSVLQTARWCGNYELVWCLDPTDDEVGIHDRPRPLGIEDKTLKDRLDRVMTNSRLMSNIVQEGVSQLAHLWMHSYGDGRGNFWRWRDIWCGNLWCPYVDPELDQWLEVVEYHIESQGY